MKTKERLMSLDVLRGLDLFFLVGLESVMHPLASAIDTEGFHDFMWNFSHVEWEGFSPWDLVMPLFLFMSGVSIPFAMSNYRKGADKSGLCQRLLKRVALLWIFGMICQGNLRGLDPDRIYLYSNTLQTIAVGYLFTVIFYLFTSWKTQAGIAVLLLLGYWGAMKWVTVDGFGGGNYTPDLNLAEWIDRTVLGRFRDGASVEDGVVQFAPWYRYTWILSSLNFIVTVMTGCFAGQILRHVSFKPNQKALLLAVAGAVLVAAGWLWNIEFPVIKKLWTSSMVLVSSGYCFLLMAVSYYIVDVKGLRRGTEWLRVYGMNSIMAYMLAQCINFRSVAHSLFHGVEQYVGPAWYQVLMAASCSIIIYIILWRMYKLRIFLRV
ncbi:MAG: DUF5009 domain-containing protein [Bacteroidaceae bacterium]|nr:DUF5009 domain-containing protein [Bacteroidaceae bacterium]MDO5488993.1 DUF5009 domain-containing protein [Bacteroidaceae bacterium]